MRSCRPQAIETEEGQAHQAGCDQQQRCTTQDGRYIAQLDAPEQVAAAEAKDAAEEDEQSAAAIARRNAERRAAAEAAATVADTAPTGGEDAAEGDAPAEGAEPAQGAPTPAPRGSLRDAAAAVLAAWDASPAQDATDNPSSRAIRCPCSKSVSTVISIRLAG